MNRLKSLFEKKNKDVLAVYFTAGFPTLESTLDLAIAAEASGADIIEIGVPFSDPVADGPTIQEASTRALENGMSVPKLLEQLATLRNHVKIPVVLMGYLNPILQYGIEAFCRKAKEVGIDGMILPDLPVQEFEKEYQQSFEQNDLYNIFLITPQTSDARIKAIDAISKGFIYMVSSASTTGAKSGISQEQIAYFERIKTLSLNSPTLIGFGISDRDSFQTAAKYANGAIIGSALVKAIGQNGAAPENAATFIKSITS